MRKKRKKPPLNLRLYFTAIVLAETFGIIILASLLARLLGGRLNITIGFPAVILMLLFSTVLGYSINFILSRAFFHPITRLGESMQKVAKGDFSPRLNTNSMIWEVQELYTNFNIMAQELNSTEIIQTDFVSNVSHEFKTPINAIQGYATLLQNENNSPEDQAQYIRKILLNTRRLSDLVGNILLLSKLDNSSLEKNTNVFRLDEQIRLAIVLLEEKWSVKNIEFDVELVEITYNGYEKLLAHVWSNLIDNAIKFSPNGGLITMRLTDKGGEDASALVFTIEDNGPGIPPEHREHIFERFFQTDSSHKAEGNGLGLSLVRKIVSVCEGTISVEDCEGHSGCRFRITLPKNML